MFNKHHHTKTGAYLGEILKLIKNLEIKFGERGHDIDFARIKLSLLLSKNPGFSRLQKLLK